MKQRPNIILILADDMGFSDLGCYGSEINTPNLDRLAEEGLRFTQFYNAARCMPTRTSLLTGLHPHQAGCRQTFDENGKQSWGHLNDHCVTFAEALKPAGYKSYATGKWGVSEVHPHWPIDRGFDRYYGLISGACNYFDLDPAKNFTKGIHFADGNKEHMPPNEGFYTTDAFTDFAVRCIDEHDEEDPFFLYLAYTAPHWPLHAHPEDIAKYRGKYKEGWKQLRRQRHQRLLELGLIEECFGISEPDDKVADWDTLTDEQKDDVDLKMAIYAAQIDCMDRGVGRVVDALQRNGYDDDTLVMFLSDNGACWEGGPLGGDFMPETMTGPIGGVDSYHSYGRSWANVGNTPFRLYKKWIHEGGISTPFIAHFPGRISQPGSITQQVGHILDIMPTCCDLAGIDYPQTYNGHSIIPTDGLSLLPIFEGKERVDHELLHWEHMGNRAVRSGRWKLVEDASRDGDDNWELYDMKTDRTERHDLSGEMPERVEELKAQYLAWAKRVGV